MGKQARARAERREARQVRGRPTQLLGELLQRIRDRSHEHPRRCWEMMLEILGHHSAVNSLFGGCLSAETAKLLPDLGDLKSLLVEYLTSWQTELQLCADSGSAITDPIGAVLEQAGGTNESLGQFFTPTDVVRMVNAVTFGEGEPPDRPEHVLDSACGSGRFALDALVHRPKCLTYNVDLDLWMMRAALVNFRLACRFSLENLTVPGKDGRPQHVLRLGGRARIIRADSLLVDLTCVDNWRYSWLWNPPPWESTMKLAGFNGTYDELRRQRPGREVAHLEAAQRERQRSERLVDFQLDEAKLHAELLRSSNLPIPALPDRSGAIDLGDFETSGMLPFGASGTLRFGGDRDPVPALLRGRGRGR